MAITKFAEKIPCEIKIYPIPDIAESEKFANYILSQIFYQSGEKINSNGFPSSAIGISSSDIILDKRDCIIIFVFLC
jgi:hypothetical protein